MGKSLNLISVSYGRSQLDHRLPHLQPAPLTVSTVLVLVPTVLLLFLPWCCKGCKFCLFYQLVNPRK